MFHLPACPYCGAAYYYKEVKATGKSRVRVCYHCKKKFGVRKRRWLLGLAAVLLVALDFFLLWVIPTVNLIALYVLTLCLLAACLPLSPYAVQFLALDKKNRK